VEGGGRGWKGVEGGGRGWKGVEGGGSGWKRWFVVLAAGMRACLKGVLKWSDIYAVHIPAVACELCTVWMVQGHLLLHSVAPRPAGCSA
jgi:hypothetical protein